MPLEFEYKWVLKVSDELIQNLEDQCELSDVFQVYLTKNNRFRKIIKRDQAPIYTHTFKYKMDTGLLEIESEVTEDDFNLVDKSSIPFGRLRKHRYTLIDGPRKWDFDFLMQGDQIYFALAECEQPEDIARDIHPLIANHIELEVPQNHNSTFSNFKLSDVTYAKKIVAEFKALHGIRP